MQEVICRTFWLERRGIKKEKNMLIFYIRPQYLQLNEINIVTTLSFIFIK